MTNLPVDSMHLAEEYLQYYFARNTAKYPRIIQVEFDLKKIRN